MLSIIIPANNEEGFIGPCLDALLASEGNVGAVEIIVSSNASIDATVAEAEVRRSAADARGWSLVILDGAEPGKPAALNRADAAAKHGSRAYLDADVLVEPALLQGLMTALDSETPVFTSGRLTVARARSWITRRYAETWVRLPFMQSAVPGAGLFAVNALGRARWDEFPDVISDDTYVRLQFTPDERAQVEARYHWPLVEGARRLIRVRRRQITGDREIAAKYPELMANEGKSSLGISEHLKLFFAAPLSYAVYSAIIACVRFGDLTATERWDRGR
ncbi:MAG: glycosyltransferase [Pseudomonadota bacterium]